MIGIESCDAGHSVGNQKIQVDRLLEKARYIGNSLRSNQDEHDALGTYSPYIHRFFKENGFYKILLPRHYGGLELCLADYYRIMIEIARGHPAIGWNLTLGASHALLIASHWPKAAQDEIFGDLGHFVAPHRAFPSGTCHKVKGGFILNGVFNYCTGVTYSTHLIVNTLYSNDEGKKTSINCILPRDNYEILDDWGGDRILGMRASGSNSVRVTQAFVPERMASLFSGFYANQDVSQGTHGTRLHSNPMYLGYLMLPYHANLVVPIIGAAKAALDEYKEILNTRSIPFSSAISRADDSDYQRAFGQSQILAQSAEAILFDTCHRHAELEHRWQRTGQPISVVENIKAWGVMQRAGHLASEAIELLFRTAGSRESVRHSKLLRYFSDAQMYRGHVGSQPEAISTYVGRAELNKPLNFLDL